MLFRSEANSDVTLQCALSNEQCGYPDHPLCCDGLICIKYHADETPHCEYVCNIQGETCYGTGQGSCCDFRLCQGSTETTPGTCCLQAGIVVDTFGTQSGGAPCCPGLEWDAAKSKCVAQTCAHLGGACSGAGGLPCCTTDQPPAPSSVSGPLVCGANNTCIWANGGPCGPGTSGICNFGGKVRVSGPGIPNFGG